MSTPATPVPPQNQPSTVAADSRAIVLTEVSELGGAERACLALSRWLYTRGLANHLVTYSDTASLAQAASHPLTVLQLRPGATPVSKVLALSHELRLHPGAPQPLLSGYQPALHATLAGFRGFHTLMHDTPSLFSSAHGTSSPKAKLMRVLSDRITGHGLRSGGQTIVTSTYLREESRRVFHVDATILRMGGLGSIDDFRLRPPNAKLNLFSVSRVESNKRIDWMLRALAAIERSSDPLSRSVDWHLDVAGRGSQLSAMRSLASELRLGHRVHFHGFVTDDALETFYARADLFLMPAVQGYGIPAIEALQRGIPVLLHRDSGVSDILLDTPWATVFEGGERAMLPALRKALRSVRSGRHLDQPLPPIPSENSWAEQVATLCGWL